MATTTRYFNSAGANNWYAPYGVANVVVEGWGGGGAGANRTTAGQGGGGAGGAYAKLNAFSAIAGTTYPLVVGAGGNSNNSSNGVNTTFNTNSLIAKGGNSVANNTATGATAPTGSTGDVLHDGGSGVNGDTTIWGGGGGSSGGTGANGRAGQGNTGGGNGTDSANLPAGAGAGGNGGKSNGSVGTDGVAPGGAGGGAARAASTNRKGGNGAVGRIKITYDYTPNAVQFDGSTQYGTISTFAGLDAVLGTFTIEGWVWLDPTCGAYAYYTTCENAAGDNPRPFGFQLRDLITGFDCWVAYDVVTSESKNSTGGLTSGVWCHWAMVALRDGVIKVYINGTEVGAYAGQTTGSNTPIATTGLNLYIGRRNPGDVGAAYWKGGIGGFYRMWNRTLSAGEILNNRNLRLKASNESGLIINLNFLEGSGTVVDNEATAGADMNLTGTPPWIEGVAVSDKVYPNRMGFINHSNPGIA